VSIYVSLMVNERQYSYTFSLNKASVYIYTVEPYISTVNRRAPLQSL